jgi:hypothetical protein
VGEGKSIAEYRVHYEDGSQEAIPVIYGEDLRDWWDGSKTATRAKLGWDAETGWAYRLTGAPIRFRLYLTTWQNPRPDRKVNGIDYVRMKNTVAAPFCVAMTIEPPGQPGAGGLPDGTSGKQGGDGPPAQAAAPPGEPRGQPAGQPQTVADYSSVEVRPIGSFTFAAGGPIVQLTIHRGDKCREDVTADEKLRPLLKTIREGSTLRVILDTGGAVVRVNTPATVLVTMPALEEVHLDVNSQAKVEGFGPGKEFRAVLLGKSILEGKILADKVIINATDSEANLSGSAKDLHLKAIGDSHLRLADLAADNATVEMVGPLEARIQVKEHLDYKLTGPCHLEYRGSPTINMATIIGPGRATRLTP